jgi:hypothetical protein
MNKPNIYESGDFNIFLSHFWPTKYFKNPSLFGETWPVRKNPGNKRIARETRRWTRQAGKQSVRRQRLIFGPNVGFRHYVLFLRQNGPCPALAKVRNPVYSLNPTKYEVTTTPIYVARVHELQSTRPTSLYFQALCEVLTSAHVGIMVKIPKFILLFF